MAVIHPSNMVDSAQFCGSPAVKVLTTNRGTKAAARPDQAKMTKLKIFPGAYRAMIKTIRVTVIVVDL